VNGIGPMPVGENRSRRIGVVRTAKKKDGQRSQGLRAQSWFVPDEDVRNRVRFEFERRKKHAPRCLAHPVRHANSGEMHARGDIRCNAAKHRWAKQSLGNFTSHMCRPVFLRVEGIENAEFRGPGLFVLSDTADAAAAIGGRTSFCSTDLHADYSIKYANCRE